MVEGRRLGTFLFAPEVIYRLFTEGTKLNFEVLKGIPKTATPYGFYIDNSCGMVGIVCYDEDFEEVREGYSIPIKHLEVKTNGQA